MKPASDSLFRQLGVAIFALLVALALAAPALAVPVTVTHQNLAPCDFLLVPDAVDELGLVFPVDERISSAFHDELDQPACIPTNQAIVDQIVDITNLTTRSFNELWYVADPETTITNVDGLVNGEEAFRIDSVGVNVPLIAEIGGALPGIFEPGETWRFILQDYSNTAFVSPAMLGSIGVPSPVSTISSGSIIAIPEPGTILLAGLALTGLALMGRKRPKA
jgi:hypothetical protein